MYTDFSKALDKFDHNSLLFKLANADIQNDILKWVKFYIRNRFEEVVLNGFPTRYFPTTSAIFQRTHLGPSLFIIFMNNKNKCFKCTDVLKIFLKCHFLDDKNINLIKNCNILVIILVIIHFRMFLL